MTFVEAAFLSEGMHVFHFTAQMPNTNYPTSIKSQHCEYYYSVAHAEMHRLPSPITASQTISSPAVLGISIQGSNVLSGGPGGDDDDIVASCEKSCFCTPINPSNAL